MLSSLRPKASADVEVPVGLHVEVPPQLPMLRRVLALRLPRMRLSDGAGRGREDLLHAEHLLSSMLFAKDVQRHRRHAHTASRGATHANLVALEEEGAGGVTARETAAAGAREGGVRGERHAKRFGCEGQWVGKQMK